MCSEEQAQRQIELLEELVKQTKLTVSNRPQEDQTYYISDTQSQWFLDYKQRKHIYAFSPNALTLQLNDIGTIAMPAKTWCDVSFRQGMQIFTSGQASLVPIYVRSTDETITGAYSGSAAVITGTVAVSSLPALPAGSNLIGQVEDIEPAAYIAASSPPSTTNVGSDTSYTFSSQVNRIILQNNTSANVNYAFDVAASAGALVLAPGSTLVYPKKCTVLHLFTAAAQNINGTSAGNIVVLGAL